VTTGLPQAPIKPPVTKTYSGKCLLTFGLAFKATTFGASTLVIEGAPDVAKSRGYPTVARHLGVARVLLNNPMTIYLSAVFSGELIFEHCECRGASRGAK
jgi:hypothetical protein